MIALAYAAHLSPPQGPSEGGTCWITVVLFPARPERRVWQSLRRWHCWKYAASPPLPSFVSARTCIHALSRVVSQRGSPHKRVRTASGPAPTDALHSKYRSLARTWTASPPSSWTLFLIRNSSKLSTRAGCSSSTPDPQVDRPQPSTMLKPRTRGRLARSLRRLDRGRSSTRSTPDVPLPRSGTSADGRPFERDGLSATRCTLDLSGGGAAFSYTCCSAFTDCIPGFC